MQECCRESLSSCCTGVVDPADELMSCSDPSSHVNSCIFVAVLHFPVFEALADNGLPINKLIVLSSDGPNVNAAITNLVDKELTDSHLPMMVDIGSCSLHKVHNAFAKRLATFRILPRYNNALQV